MLPWRERSDTGGTPAATYTLIATNILAYFIVNATYGHVESIYDYGVRPSNFSLISLLTAPFLHGGFLHLAGNMYFLWIFGSAVEEAIGRKSFVGFYMLFGLIAGLADLAARMDSQVPAIGASGAISGIMAMHCVVFPRARFKFFSFTKGVQGLSGIGLLAYFMLMDIMGALLSMGSEDGGGIAHFAHLGGTFSGFVVGTIFSFSGMVPEPAPPKAATLAPELGGPRLNAASAVALQRRPSLAAMSPEQILAMNKKRKADLEREHGEQSFKLKMILGTGGVLLIWDLVATVLAVMLLVLLYLVSLLRLAFVALFPVMDGVADAGLKWLSKYFWVWYGLFWLLWLLMHAGGQE